MEETLVRVVVAILKLAHEQDILASIGFIAGAADAVLEQRIDLVKIWDVLIYLENQSRIVRVEGTIKGIPTVYFIYVPENN